VVGTHHIYWVSSVVCIVLRSQGGILADCAEGHNLPEPLACPIHCAFQHNYSGMHPA